MEIMHSTDLILFHFISHSLDHSGSFFVIFSLFFFFFLHLSFVFGWFSFDFRFVASFLIHFVINSTISGLCIFQRPTRNSSKCRHLSQLTKIRYNLFQSAVEFGNSIQMIQSRNEVSAQHQMKCKLFRIQMMKTVSSFWVRWHIEQLNYVLSHEMRGRWGFRWTKSINQSWKLQHTHTRTHTTKRKFSWIGKSIKCVFRKFAT